MRQFAGSEEAAALGGDVHWATLLLEHARMLHRVTVTDLSPEDVEEIVFVDIPRQVSCEASAAAACARVLGKDAEAKLRKRLSDPRYFGMAKSFIMSGRAAGVDMTTQEGAAAWMAEANARMGLGGGFDPRSPAPRTAPKADAAKKKKRKAERASRRKSRR